MGIIIDIIRSFLWGLAYAVFVIGDAIYDVTIQVGSLDIGQLSLVWDWWALLSIMIAGISMIRILIMGVRYFLEEDLQEKLDFFKIFGRVMLVSMAIALMPLGVKYITGAGQVFVQNVGLVTGHQDTSTPSTLIISSVIGDSFKVEDGAGGYEIPKTYALSDIDINHKTEGSKDYQFFNEMGDLFVLIIMGGIAVVGLVLVGIEVAERYFKLGIKILISPIPISGLVNPDDQGFQKWYRLVIADVVLNCIQILSLFFILTVASSNTIRTKGVWVTLVMFIGGLFAVLKGVPELAPIIGGDSSTQGALQQMAAIRQATNGMGSFVGGAVGGAVGAVGGALATTGAGATYGVGRALGGKSIAEIESDKWSNQSDNNQNNMNGNSNNEFKSGGQDIRNQDRSNVQTSSNANMYDSASVNSDASSVNKNGFNVNGTDGNGSNSGSYGFNDELLGRETTSRKENEPRFENNQQKRNDTDRERTFNENNLKQNNLNTLAKPNTFASNYVEKAYSEKGGRFAKLASTAGRHVYQNSTNRLNQTMPARASTMYRKAMESKPSEREVL